MLRKTPLTRKPMTRKAPIEGKQIYRHPMKRKARKTASKADREHMGKVAEIGCVLCIHLGFGATPAEVHHPRTGTGMGLRAAHKDTISLCPEHHRGDTGLHGLGRKAFEATYQLTEGDLLALTRQALES